MAASASGCIAGTTDPSALLNCPSGNSAVLSSSGPSGGPVGNAQNPKPTPIVNTCMQIEQQSKQNVGGLKLGGFIGAHYAAGGLVRRYATGGATGCPISTSGVPVNTQGANAGILQTEEQNATSPSLKPNETVNAQLIQNSSCQMLCPTKYNVGTPQVAATTGGNATTVAPVTTPKAATYCAATISNAPQVSAATMAVPGNPSSTASAGSVSTNPAFSVAPSTSSSTPQNSCALVSNQIAMLTNGLNTDNAPAWAQGAINATNSQMAARGLGTSSIAAGANTAAIENAALPVATANSNVIMQANLANLSNEQQALLANQQAQLATLTSNQAAVNAASQFNATSENQVTQFFDNLNSQIQLSNAAQVNAMKQFNAGQLNSVAEYNATLANNVAQFNAQNQLAIDQSNVTWRRNINTLNTAAVNSANQVNAQNEFNMSSTAQTNLWQQFQDEASWANTDAQNSLTRAQNLAIASLGANTAFGLQSAAEQAQMLNYLGAFGLNLLGPTVGSTLNGLFSSTGSAAANSAVAGAGSSVSCTAGGGLADAAKNIIGC